MKAGFKISGRVFKYLAALFTLAYWVYIIIDDWTLIEKYWTGHWGEYIEGWSVWFLIYFSAFSFYYWVAAAIVVFSYFKLFRENPSKF